MLQAIVWKEEVALKQNAHRQVVLGLAGLVILLAIGFWHCWQPAANSTAPVSVSSSQDLPVNSASAPHAPTVIDPLQATYAKLLLAKGGALSRQQLAELSRWLASLPPKEAAAAIRRFLDSKANATTGLGFKVGKDGKLNSAPTLRTFLLDQLARVDPAGAADYSRQILADSTSPDEWAVALRNLAEGDSSAEGRALLAQKTADLLGNTAWQQNPSVGYLEAFDTAVYLGDTQMVPTLTGLVGQTENPAVAHAAFLAMDRMVINNPTTMLASLAADPTMMQGNENTRADYFARADVRDPQQMQIVENYLLNPQISAAEIGDFTAIFPNANYMISDNLLTPTQMPTRAFLTGRDAASLQAIQGWLADARFANIQSQLQLALVRLQQFVQQESQGQ